MKRIHWIDRRSRRIGTIFTGIRVASVVLMLLGLVGCLVTTTPTSATLTLQLASSLDGDGDIKVTSFTQAVLIDTSGKMVKTGTVAGNLVSIDLSGLAAGDFSIELNGDGDDLLPTRIDDPTQSNTQFVGQKLRASAIGSLEDPSYRIATHPKGQGEHAVVKYSDGSNVTPERYAYAIVAARADRPITEIRVLGTDELLSSFTASRAFHPAFQIAQPMSTWVLNTPPNSFHCDVYGGDETRCTLCHPNLNSKPQQHSEVSPTNGLCFQCHYGKGGSEMGFVDPNQ
ncbi:MAG: hypothetical protein HY287_03720 [Planctomycetes bacterium]|nr:hypothetical protein [Planctomycetota bacterium]MBI3833420.1 hypothetical protein [Planctomycetota bacterium]